MAASNIITNSLCKLCDIKELSLHGCSDTILELVCGLKWSYDNRELASGGNDNRLFVWNQHSTQPVLKYCEHTAAVKAIAWSTHVHGLLAFCGEYDSDEETYEMYAKIYLYCPPSEKDAPGSHCSKKDYEESLSEILAEYLVAETETNSAMYA
ncbi:FIZZY-related 2-like protein [Tanacetum coccineum]